MYLRDVLLMGAFIGFSHASGSPDLWEEARTAHEKLQTQVDQKIFSAMTTLLGYANTMETNLVLYTTNTTTTITNEHNALVELINKLKIRAENANVDAAGCTSILETRLRRLPDTVTSDVSTCMNKRYLEGRDSIDDALLYVQEPNQEVLRLSTIINECSEAIDEDGCLNDAIGDIYIKQNELISTITETTTQTNGLVNTYQVSMLSCTLNRAKIVTELGNFMVGNMTTCVEELINPSTTPVITTPAPPEPTTIQ